MRSPEDPMRTRIRAELARLDGLKPSADLARDELRDELQALTVEEESIRSMRSSLTLRLERITRAKVYTMQQLSHLEKQTGDA
jgi:hypothetical protein